MRAVAVSPGGELEVVDRPDPLPAPDEVVVAVERCGICGSDVSLRRSGLLPAGAVLGHEFAGTVVALGAAATGHVDTGRRVAVLPARRCGTCDACRSGRSHLCPAQAATAIGLGRNDGGYAEYVRVPVSSCHPLPDHVSPELGALVEPFAVALHAVARSRASGEQGPAVGVIGAGAIGLLCAVALTQAGVERVVVAERNARRAAVAEAVGATVLSDAAALASAGPLDVVFDAAGGATTLSVGLQAVRAGGQLVLVGAGDPTATLDVPGLLVLVKEVDITPSMSYSDEEFSAAVATVSSGAVDAGLVALDVRPLEDAEQAFRDLSGDGAPTRVMLAP